MLNAYTVSTKVFTLITHYYHNKIGTVGGLKCLLQKL
jgi:hypothetical protein